MYFTPKVVNQWTPDSPYLKLFLIGFFNQSYKLHYLQKKKLKKKNPAPTD